MKSVKSILVAIAFVTLLFAVSGCAQSVEKVELERRIPLCEDSEMALQMSCSFDWPLKGYNQSSLRAIQRNIIQCCLSEDTDYESFLLNWESAFYGKMNEPYNGIVSYVYDHYTYTGGAHGGTYRGALNMDEKTGRILTESDIFEPENYQILTSLVREYLPKCTEMDMIDDPAISPSSDFYITSEGITYIYQQYEIGPYALGIVEVLIPWSELTFLK